MWRAVLPDGVGGFSGFRRSRKRFYGRAHAQWSGCFFARSGWQGVSLRSSRFVSEPLGDDALYPGCDLADGACQLRKTPGREGLGRSCLGLGSEHPPIMSIPEIGGI